MPKQQHYCWMRMTSRLLLTMAAICSSVLAQIGDPKSPYVRDGKLAKAFCASPAFKSLTCGLASKDEIGDTFRNQCLGCGTLYTYIPDLLPDDLESHPNYKQFAIATASLACSGPVEVRSVFKILKQRPITSSELEFLDGTSCADARLALVDDEPICDGGTATSIVRCALELPSSQGSEEQRAVESKEVNCTICNHCGNGGGCPSALNTWYSDSYMTARTGCGFDPAKGFMGQRIGIRINPGTTIRLAKFEVCNLPSCFDVKVEQAKLKSAKRCARGKCDSWGDAGYVEDGKLAKAFCASPAFKSLTCGLASRAEQHATLRHQWPAVSRKLCTSIPQPLPATLAGLDSNNRQFASDVASLACSGPVIVRAVFKILKQPPLESSYSLLYLMNGTSCADAQLDLADEQPICDGGTATSIVRCALELPAGQGSEEQRAVESKEVNCTICNLCDNVWGGCPSALNTWYSDSYMTALTGCGFDPAQGYKGQKLGIRINPGTTIRLAKFEVCNSPSCFDVKAEQAKLKSAKRCVSGNCG